MASDNYDWAKARGADDVDTYDTPGGQVQVPTQDTFADRDFNRALAASREEFGKPSHLPEHQIALDAYCLSDKSSMQQQSKDLEDREVAMILSLSNQFSPFLDPGADTLIYIGPPPQAKDQSRADYQYIQQRFSALHRVKSQTLKDLGSSVFEKLLGPKSERTRRRLGKDGLLTGVHLDNIEYYIDLRPPEEGDEAVELISDLTCSRGILDWHKAQSKYSIAPTMVCGRDDFVSLQDHMAADVKENDESNDTKPQRAPEYHALRHRLAIERVVQAIFHNDPKIDSAPKMWTFFQVAKHLDVAKHERINGWITKWLYTHPNSNFIQSNPEAVYRIGVGTMSTNILRDGYSMIAGEKALLHTCDPNVRMHLQTSMHGRPLEILDDDERNRIDHAASSLYARMKLKFEQLVDQSMNWLKGSTEYAKLFTLRPKNSTERETISATDVMIKDYVRGRILWAMARNYTSDHPEFDQNLRTATEFHPGLPETFHGIYAALTEEQRLLTRTMWITLHNEKLEDGYINTFTPAKSSTGAGYAVPLFSQTSGLSRIDQSMIDREKLEHGTGVVELLYNDLSDNVDKVNEISKQHWAQVSGVKNTINQKYGGFQPAASSSVEYFDVLGPQAESSSAGGKHDLIEFDEDDQPLEMTTHSRARSGSDKRQRLMEDGLVLDQDDHYIATVGTDEYLNTTIPLRARNPDLTDQEAPVTRTEHDTHGGSQLDSATASRRTATEFSSATGDASFDTNAKSVAESNNYTNWISSSGEVYVRPKVNYVLTINSKEVDTHKIWFVKPQPFKPSETMKGTANGGCQYWRATTCQLYSQLPGGQVNLVRENLAATPTLAEAATRINDPAELKIYEIAYDAYARDLAEQLSLPYYTSLKGDMYLRNPPDTMSADANIWMNSKLIFDAAGNTKKSGFENGAKVEYWRAPSTHLFRRSAGRIDLFTEGKEENAPPNAASILATKLKLHSSTGMQGSYAPPARFMDRTNAPQGHSYWSPPRPPARRSSVPPPPSDGCEWTYINPKTMLIQFSDLLSRYCEDILYPPHIYHGAEPIPQGLMDTLMCLGHDEWKYLPLWAGGNDDGTGGVFDEVDVPNLEAGGFRGGKRGLGSGSGSGIDGIDSDGFTDVGSEAISTVGRASKLATDGTETVKSFDSSSSSSAEGFMKQDELWEQIRDMKDGQDRPVAAEAEADEVTTVRGAGSDIQGQMFGDVDSDDDGELGVDEEDEDIDFVDDEDLA
jgi:hypothetical protein